MKTQELTQQELVEINGGGLLGLNILGLGASGSGITSSNTQGGLGTGLSIGNLLTFHNTSQSGTTTSLSLGNNIGLNLQGLINGL